MSLATGLSSTPPSPLTPFVLLVDDQEPCLSLLHIIVESAGYHCVSFSSGIDALVYCDMRTPQAVVTDLELPWLNGAVLANWLKARYPSIPLLLVTGQDLEDASIERLRSTFSEILPKPVDPRRLLAVLEHSIAAPVTRGSVSGLP